MADSDDESSEDEVFGITSVINLSHHKVMHNLLLFCSAVQSKNVVFSFTGCGVC